MVDNITFQRKSDQFYGEDGIKRLGLPARTENALWRNNITTVSELIDLLNKKYADRPEIRNIGVKGWKQINDALDRPFLPYKPLPYKSRDKT